MVVFIIFYLLLKAGEEKYDLTNESLNNNSVCKAAIANASGSANYFKVTEKVDAVLSYLTN